MKLPRGIRNNNPLNIRKGNDWQGERHPQTDKEFEEFESMAMGLRAAFKLLKNWMNGFGGKRKPCTNLEQLISTWAPEIENATRAYILFVSNNTGIHPRQEIKFQDRATMCAIVRAMAFVECGVWIDPEVIKTAYDLV